MDTIIATTEERADFVTGRFMRKRQDGKGRNGRQARRCKGKGTRFILFFLSFFFSSGHADSEWDEGER